MSGVRIVRRLSGSLQSLCAARRSVVPLSQIDQLPSASRDPFHSALVHNRTSTAEYAEACRSFHSESTSKESKTAGAIGAWFLAGAAPLCFLSTAAAAKEKAPVDLPGEVVLYQYEACPFCNKVKAYLDYRSIPYRIVEVNPLGKKELKWSQYKKVPVIVVDNEQLNDSTAIISDLESRLYPSKKQAANEEEEMKWRRWVDDHLVHLLSPNIYRTPQEALEAFEYITTNGNFSVMERTMAKYSGAASMYFISKRLKKRHNIENERESLYKAAEEWMENLKGRKFLGGDKPNLADLAVFGVLRPIRYMRAGRDLMENTSILPWYERMEAEVGDSCRLLSAST